MEYKKVDKEDNRITLRLDKEMLKKFKEESKIKEKPLSTIIKEHLNRQMLTLPKLETNEEFPKIHLKLLDTDVIIGPRWGKPDPYVPFLEQFEIKIIQGKKILSLNFPKMYGYNPYDILNSKEVSTVFNDLLEFGNKWKDAIFEYKKIFETLNKKEKEEKEEYRSKIRTLLDIIDVLEKKMGSPIPKEEIVAEAQKNGIDEEKLEDLLKLFKNEGVVFEPKLNYIERIR